MQDVGQWGQPREWSAKRLAVAEGFPSFDLAAGNRVVGFPAEQSKPETFLRVLLNVSEELRRRAR